MAALQNPRAVFVSVVEGVPVATAIVGKQIVEAIEELLRDPNDPAAFHSLGGSAAASIVAVSVIRCWKCSGSVLSSVTIRLPMAAARCSASLRDRNGVRPASHHIEIDPALDALDVGQPVHLPHHPLGLARSA